MPKEKIDAVSKYMSNFRVSKYVGKFRVSKYVRNSEYKYGTRYQHA